MLLAHAACSCHLALLCSVLDVPFPFWHAFLGEPTRSYDLIDLTESNSLWVVLAVRSFAFLGLGSPPLPRLTKQPARSCLLVGVEFSAADEVAWLQNPRNPGCGFPIGTCQKFRSGSFPTTSISNPQRYGLLGHMAHVLGPTAMQLDLSQSSFLLWAPLKDGSLHFTQYWDPRGIPRFGICCLQNPKSSTQNGDSFFVVGDGR